MPSAMSKSTISPSSFNPASSAKVPPIWPAPINAILVRAIGLFPSREAHSVGAAPLCLDANPVASRSGAERNGVGDSRLDDPAKIAGADPCGMRLRQIFGRAHFD